MKCMQITGIAGSDFVLKKEFLLLVDTDNNDRTKDFT